MGVRGVRGAGLTVGGWWVGGFKRPVWRVAIGFGGCMVAAWCLAVGVWKVVVRASGSDSAPATRPSRPPNNNNPHMLRCPTRSQKPPLPPTFVACRTSLVRKVRSFRKTRSGKRWAGS